MDPRNREANRDYVEGIAYVLLFFGALFIAGVLLAVA